MISSRQDTLIRSSASSLIWLAGPPEFQDMDNANTTKLQRMISNQDDWLLTTRVWWFTPHQFSSSQTGVVPNLDQI